MRDGLADKLMREGGLDAIWGAWRAGVITPDEARRVIRERFFWRGIERFQ